MQKPEVWEHTPPNFTRERAQMPVGQSNTGFCVTSDLLTLTFSILPSQLSTPQTSDLQSYPSQSVLKLHQLFVFFLNLCHHFFNAFSIFLCPTHTHTQHPLSVPAWSSQWSSVAHMHTCGAIGPEERSASGHGD